MTSRKFKQIFNLIVYARYPKCAKNTRMESPNEMANYIFIL